MILKHAAASLGTALFLAAFGAVYEHFSFGVYSNYMIYSFAFPLIAGLLLVLAAAGKHPPSPRTLLLLHSSSAAFAVGSITAGILRISGREHSLLIVYPVLGLLLCISALASYRSESKAQTY